MTTVDCEYAAVTEKSPPGPASDGLAFTVRREDGAVILAVRGEIDLRTAPELRAHLDDTMAESDGRPCVIDLTAVTFMGSPGLATLLEATARARHRHITLSFVVDANLPVVRPIQITGIDRELALYHTIAEALASHGAASQPSGPYDR